MMGRQDKQLRMVVFDLSSMIPKDHLLRAIKENIDFNFIYEAVSDRYSSIGRPSIDPTLLIKMLLIGFIYGIKSERRLEEEVHLNLVVIPSQKEHCSELQSQAFRELRANHSEDREPSIPTSGSQGFRAKGACKGLQN